MKIPYQKPWVLYEHFSSSQSGSGSCVMTATFTDGSTCEIESDVGILYLASNSECQRTPPSGNDFFCYNNPSGSGIIITS